MLLGPPVHRLQQGSPCNEWEFYRSSKFVVVSDIYIYMYVVVSYIQFVCLCIYIYIQLGALVWVQIGVGWGTGQETSNTTSVLGWGTGQESAGCWPILCWIVFYGSGISMLIVLADL